MQEQSEAAVFQSALFAGKIALITGGGTGIGAAISRMLARHGASLVLASRRRNHLEATAMSLQGLGREVLVCELDVRERAACDRVVTQTLDRFGQIDLLVNNAAANFLVPAAALNERGWHTVVDIVLHGTFNMCQAVHAAMRKAGGGSIVNITATYSGWSAPLMVHSGAAKAGVLNLTRTLATEWGCDAVRVNAVAPGLVEHTEGARRLAGAIGFIDAYRQEVPLGRLAQVEDVAAAVLFLASPAASFITGVELTVDGGASLAGQFRRAREALDQALA